MRAQANKVVSVQQAYHANTQGSRERGYEGESQSPNSSSNYQSGSRRRQSSVMRRLKSLRDERDQRKRMKNQSREALPNYKEFINLESYLNNINSSKKQNQSD
jgi:hypothetical protein